MLTPQEIELIADAVVRKFIEHGKRRSSARFTASLSIEERKRKADEEFWAESPRRKKR